MAARYVRIGQHPDYRDEIRGTLSEILASTANPGTYAAPEDVTGTYLEMGADGLWTGASVGTLTQVQADALVASGDMGKVKIGTPAEIDGKHARWTGTAWQSDLIVGPFADIAAANAWAAANPSSLFPGLLATAGGAQYRWNGPGATDWRGIRGPYLGSAENPFPDAAALLATYTSLALPPHVGFEAWVKDANGIPQRWEWLGGSYVNWIKAEAYEFSAVPQVTLIDDSQYINGANGTVQTGFPGDKYTDYIAVEPNTTYIYRGSFSDARGYAQYNSAKAFVQGADGMGLFPGLVYPNRVAKILVFTTAATTAWVRFSVEVIAATYTLEKVLTRKNNAAAIKDYQYDLPEYVFGIDNDSADGFYAREYAQSLPVEGVVASTVPVKLDGERALRIQNQAKNTTTKSTTAIPVTLSESGYATKTGSISFIKTKASIAKNSVIRYLAIGDSITANQKPGLDGVYAGGWCYPSCAKEFLMMDNADAGDNLMKLILLGTTNFKTTSFDYGGATLSLRGLSEGRGSWTTCNYLRHAMHTTTTSSGAGSDFENKAAWDAMGLGRKIPIDTVYNPGAAYEAYTNTTTQRNLIRSTPWGKYHWDYSAELWNAAKALNRNGIMNGAGAYTGSGADNTLLDTYMNYVLDNPDNPFFDKVIAKTNSYAFSLATYLARYKTLAEDGVTRLVVGSTAGSKIDAGNLANIDVCTPTHITLELGENERWWYPATAQDAADDNIAIANRIAAEYPSIKIGFVNPRWIGVMYPERWPEAVVGTFDPAGSNAFKYQINGILKTALGTLASQTNKFFLPCYHLQSPISRQDGRIDTDLGTGLPVVVGHTDNNHPGIQAYRGMGYQVLAWIYYTLATP